MHSPNQESDFIGPTAPLLKWAGGKTQLLTQLQPYFPKHYDRLIEPFIGGAAIYFHLRPPHALLGDVNPELVNFYRVVRELPEELMIAVDAIAARHADGEDPEMIYYDVRNRQPVDLPTDALDVDGIPIRQEDRVWVAARTLYLNKTGFNGLFRVNSQGRFNVPWGRRKRLPKLYSRDEIHNASLLLHGAEIVLADFGDVLDQARPGDFVYLDPPYFPVSATANFTSYTRLDFPAEQQQRLADWLHTLDQRGVAFVLNNSDTPFTREIYAGFPIDVALAKRMINSDAGKRGAVNELIVYNVT
ncbi:MAG: DNA adenine methylase [Caldilineaceae bacterium]|nr:DNA adenine methylase [Caldilineaceae bacterium]